MIDLVTPGLTARVAEHGAELVSLVHPTAGELLWQAGPAWPRHAPVLFPIVGRLPEDTLEVAGRRFRMTQHGFARDRDFTVVDRSPTRAVLRLTDDEDTRSRFPYAFVLTVEHVLHPDRLTTTYEVANPGGEPLPVSLGTHPAFVWPLPGGDPKDAHELVFAAPEPGPVHRLSEGLLEPTPLPTPVVGDRLALSEQLFAADALIWTETASRELRYASPGSAVSLTLSWQGFPQLGVWSKPGAGFLCLEPWAGYASPVAADLDISAKPGMMLLQPGEARQLTTSSQVS